MSGFKSQLFSGVVWTSFQMIVNRGFKFFIKLVLARLLFPEDYGLVGMAVVFTAIISVFTEMGMGAALVQKRKEELRSIHFHTAFWTGILWGIFIFLIICLGVAPFSAYFYDEPILKSIIPVMSIGILATPINIVHRSKLLRQMNFKKIAFISNISNIFSGLLALGLAFSGFGVWSLIFNSVASILIAMPLYFKATKWFPSLKFSKDAFNDIFGFGLYTTGTRLFSKIIGQIDYLIVGKIVGAASLGIYSLAFLLTSITRTQITQVIDQVLYPLFSKIQDSSEKMRSYYLRILEINTYLVFPVMFYLILFANDVIPFLFGDKWNEAIILIKILSFGVILSMLTSSSAILFRASGKPNIELRIVTITALVFYIPLIVGGTILYEVIGTAIGYTISVFASTIVNLIYIKRIFGIDLIQTFKAIKNPIITSSTPFAISYWLNFLELNWIVNSIIFLLILAFLLNKLAKSQIKDVKDLLRAKKAMKRKTNRI